MTHQASNGLDCPTVQALTDATAANVRNNMVALLVVGGLGLAVTVLFADIDRRSRLRGRSPAQSRTSGRAFAWGFGTAAALWALGLVTFAANTAGFIRYGHYVAAAGLFLCVFVVAASNALRRRTSQPAPEPAIMTFLRRLDHLDRYAVLAWAMIAGVAISGTLILTHLATLFWLEIVVAVLFAAFWLVQTFELVGTAPDPTAGTAPSPAVP
jgi:hypothetical protein